MTTIYNCGEANADQTNSTQITQIEGRSLQYKDGWSLRLSHAFDIVLKNPITAICWSNDSTTLAVVSEYGTRISAFDTRGVLKGTVRRNGLNLGSSLSILPGSNYILFGSASNQKQTSFLTLWDIRLGRSALDLKGEGIATVFDLSPDGTTLAVKRGRKYIAIYSVNDWSHFKMINVPETMSVLKFLPNSHEIAMGSAHGNIYLADIKSMELRKISSPFYKSLGGGGTVSGIVNSLSVDPTGKQLIVGVGLESQGLGISPSGSGEFDKSGARDWLSVRRAIQILDTTSGEDKQKFLLPVSPSIWSAIWDPKDRFVSFTDDLGSFYMWALNYKSRPYLNFNMPIKNPVLAVSPNGKYLAVSTDNGVQVIGLIEVQGN